MVGSHGVKRNAWPDKDQAGYVVIVRGADGRPRVERFTDVAAYRARLVSLAHSDNSSISIDDIAGLLDA